MKYARLLILVLTFLMAPLAARAQTADPSGDWRGVLAVSGVELRLAMHLGATSTFDSIDQGAFGLPSTMRVDGQRVSVEVTGIGDYEGVLSEDGARLTGDWLQGGLSLPLDFERGRFETASP